MTGCCKQAGYIRTFLHYLQTVAAQKSWANLGGGRGEGGRRERGGGGNVNQLGYVALHL